MLTEAERRELLAIARTAMIARVMRQPWTLPAPAGILAQPGGAFVTVRRAGELRGCIGYTGLDRLLADVVASCAVSASTEDPRFPPLAPDEIDFVSLEISILGPIEPVISAELIEVGRHGLVVEDGHRRGLLLPQVALEWGWDRETFVAQACVKAGLAPDAWRTGAKVYWFEAEVFGEEE